jgi:hypothetical protein
MITTEKLVKFLTDPEYDWEVVSPRGKTIWDIITEYQITLSSFDDGKMGSVDEEEQRTAA